MKGKFSQKGVFIQFTEMSHLLKVFYQEPYIPLYKEVHMCVYVFLLSLLDEWLLGYNSSLYITFYALCRQDERDRKLFQS